MTTLTNKARLAADRAQFVIDLTSMKAKAGQLGMYRTLQALDAATNAAGWELADLKTEKQADTVAKKASAA